MAEKKRNFFIKINKFFREFKSEIKKIVWPIPKVVFKNMGIVVLTVTIIGLFVFALDTGFLKLLSLFMNVSN